MLEKLPSELQLRIVRKLPPIPYVRLRRACKEMDEFCERQRGYIKTYSRSEPCLFLINTMQCISTFSGYFDELGKPDLDGVYALSNYGQKKWDSNLRIPITEKEQIPILRAAVSGFYFDDVLLWNRNVSQDPKKDEQFAKAFDNFLEAIQGMKPRSITVKNLTWEQIAKLQSIWKLRRVEWADSEDTERQWRHCLTESSLVILGTIEGSTPLVDLYHLARNKEVVNVDFSNFPKDQIWSAFGRIVKDWKRGNSILRYLEYGFEESPNFRNLDLTKEGNVLCELKDAVHLGSHSMINVMNIRNSFEGRMTRAYDFWLVQLQQKCWGIIKLSRTDGSSYEWVSLKLLTVSSEAVPVETIAQLYEEIFLNGPPVDLSSICDQFKGKRLEEIARLFCQKKKSLLAYWKKPHLRPLPNIIHEILTEPWSLPRSWLNLQTREKKNKEQKSVIADSFKVFFQEIFCPISQYCSL